MDFEDGFELIRLRRKRNVRNWLWISVADDVLNRVTASEVDSVSESVDELGWNLVGDGGDSITIVGMGKKWGYLRLDEV